MKNLNILIIEDESLLALNLAAKLQAFGVKFVDFVCSYDEAFDMLERLNDINLLIVDINLNNEDSGINLVDSLKLPIDIIYLTAYSDEKTIAAATHTLPLGYLLKPVDMKQLYILLKIASEKIGLQIADSKLVNLSHDYMFNWEKNSLTHRGKTVKISGKKLQLLKILIEKKGEFVSFKEVEDRLYQSNPPSESTLRTLIYRFRAHFNFSLIETEKFNGIRVNLPNLQQK